MTVNIVLLSHYNPNESHYVSRTCVLSTEQQQIASLAKVFDDYALTVTIDGELYPLLLSEIRSHQNYRRHHIEQVVYGKTDVFLLCFSVVSPSSFENVREKWAPEITRLYPSTPFLLVGTQIDLRDDASTIEKLSRANQEPISIEAAENLACELGAVKYVECSALTKEGLINVFDEAILAVVKTRAPVRRRKCILQ